MVSKKLLPVMFVTSFISVAEPEPQGAASFGRSRTVVFILVAVVRNLK
jgi:hypothetical protein